MTKTVWLLDVDGVINATKPGWGGPPARKTAWAPSVKQSFPLRWAPQLMDRIRALRSSGLVEVRWCTTWCADAAVLERLWRLPPLVRAFNEAINGDEASAAKLAAARQVLADGHRLIWTDDYEVPESGPLYDELAAGGRALLIRPRENRGLQPADLDAIEAFARHAPA